MLATGGSASKAIDLVIAAGVPENHIVFVNVVASHFGLDTLTKRFPQLNVVTAAVDANLTASKYVVLDSRSQSQSIGKIPMLMSLVSASHVDPGLGDFGDRYYGTDG